MFRTKIRKQGLGFRVSHATIGILDSWEKLPNRGYTLGLILNQF
jgi:hypothetical protein